MRVQSSETTDGMPNRRGRGRALALPALFLPVTLRGWFVFFSVLLFIWAPIPLGLLFPVSLLVLLAAAAFGRVRTAVGLFLLFVLGFYGYIQVIYLITAFLALLAGNGASFDLTSSYDSYQASLLGPLMLLGIIWLLLAVPNRAHQLGVDKDGTSGVRGLVVGLLTAGACALTGGYIWLVHYGLLANLHTGQVVAGIIFTVALVPPYYASLARACWQRGISGVLSPKPLIKRWRHVITQVESARAAEVQRARTEASRPKNVASERLSWLDRMLRWVYTYQPRSAAP
jgi:hypothetical protein